MYDYQVSPGMEDTFFQYVYDAQNATLVNGTTRQWLGVNVDNGDFLMRYWSGLPTIADRLQIYDTLNRQFASQPMFLGTNSNSGYGQMVILPEVMFPYNGRIKFDLTNINQAVAGVDGGLTVLASQLVFSGVRRREATPIPKPAPYREVKFSYPITVTINNYASTGGILNLPLKMQFIIRDYDFELRRIELALQSPSQTSQFKMQLYNQDKRMVSNLPVLSNLLCHLNPVIQSGGEPNASAGELSYWPCPPMLYRVNSLVTFDIYSLLFAPTVLPQTFQLLFDGVRRLPC